MNWLQKISQKGMPLPVTVPDYEAVEHMGIDRMDDRMTQETSDKLRQQYPEIEYGGAGMIGMAFQTGPNEIMKVTHDWGESNIAKYVFEHPMNWVVPVLEEPQMIQEYPPMWSIRMKKLQPLDNWELEFFVTDLKVRHEKNEFPDIYQVQTMIEGMSDPDAAIKLYHHIKYIIDQNDQTIMIGDIHGGNVGWDDDGHLKVFDLGPGNFDG